MSWSCRFSRSALTEHVQERWPALAHRGQASLEGARKFPGPLDTLAVTIHRLHDLLEVRRRCQIAQRKTARRLGLPVGIEAEHRTLHRLPTLVVEDDREERQTV